MGALEVIQSDPLLKSYFQSYLRLLRAESNQVLKISSDGDFTASLAPVFKCLTTTTVTYFPLIPVVLRLVAGCVCCLLPFHCVPPKGVGLCSLHNTFSDGGILQLGPLVAFSSLSRLNKCSLCSSPVTVLVVLHQTLSNLSIPLPSCSEGKLGTILQIWPKQREIITSLNLMAILVLMEPSEQLAFLTVHLWSSCCPPGSQSTSAELLPASWAPACSDAWDSSGFFCPRCRTCHLFLLPLLHLVKIPLNDSTILQRISLVSPMNSMKAQSVLLSRTLKKMLSSRKQSHSSISLHPHPLGCSSPSPTFLLYLNGP